MATAPDQTQADPAMDGSDGDESGQSGAYCIELHIGADGSITVSVEPESEEAGEEGGEYDGGSSAPEGKPMKDIKEALTYALDVYRNQGEDPGEADDSFQAGFAGSSGS